MKAVLLVSFMGHNVSLMGFQASNDVITIPRLLLWAVVPEKSRNSV